MKFPTFPRGQKGTEPYPASTVTLSAEQEEWAGAWAERTTLLRIRPASKRHFALEQAWIVRGKTKVRKEWRPIPMVDADAPMVEE